MLNLNLPAQGCSSDLEELNVRHILNGQFNNCPKLKLVKFGSGVLSSNNPKLANELLAFYLEENPGLIPYEWYKKQIFFPGTRYLFKHLKSGTNLLAFHCLYVFEVHDNDYPFDLHKVIDVDVRFFELSEISNNKNDFYFCVIDE